MFEGLALGSRLGEACPRSHLRRAILLCILFSVTAPLGVGLGMVVRAQFSAQSTRVKMVQGMMDAVSSGVLMYACWVHLVVGEMHGSGFEKWSKGWRLAGFVAVWVGVALLAVIGGVLDE